GEAAPQVLGRSPGGRRRHRPVEDPPLGVDAAHRQLRAPDVDGERDVCTLHGRGTLLGRRGAARLPQGVTWPGPAHATEETEAVASIETAAPRGTTFSETFDRRSEEHTSELQSRENLVCRLLL